MSEPRNANLGIPTTTATLKLPSVQKLSTGSATGNPRNKCALKPGHSLMDWIRLGNSGYDLSGTKGRIIPVSHAELSKHCIQNDAWIAIRGKVYNVTKYMDFHPGGSEELMRGVGKDATKLFDQVHAWVNYDQILKKCLIGPLRNAATIDPKQFLNPPDIQPILKPPTPPAVIDVIPRLDWIQKQKSVTIYIYTKQFCNPGLILTRKSDKNIILKIFIENNCHLYNIDFHAEVKWQPDLVNVSSETGKIELCLTKVHAQLWPKYGTCLSSKVQETDIYNYQFRIIENRKFNYNSHALLLSCKDVIFRVAVGYHLTFICQIGGQSISRSYTPIPKKYAPIEDGSVWDMYFLLKTYDNGVLAKHINSLRINSEIEVSPQKGSLRLHNLLSHTRIAFIVAGSGVTPILGLLDHLLSRNINKIENLVLLYFNKTEDDIWCRNCLEDLSKTDERFRLINVLSQPAAIWNKATGYVSSDLLYRLKDESSADYSTFVFTCGPPVFNNTTESILKAMGFSDTVLYFFNG